MQFNRGFLCHDCGPIEKAQSKTIAKIKHNVCPNCSKIVQSWTRPLKERSGRCQTCGNASFELRIWKHQLLRKCKTCETVFNTDTEKILREGKG